VHAETVYAGCISSRGGQARREHSRSTYTHTHARTESRVAVKYALLGLICSMQTAEAKPAPGCVRHTHRWRRPAQQQGACAPALCRWLLAGQHACMSMVWRRGAASAMAMAVGQTDTRSAAGRGSKAPPDWAYPLTWTAGPGHPPGAPPSRRCDVLPPSRSVGGRQVPCDPGCRPLPGGREGRPPRPPPAAAPEAPAC